MASIEERFQAAINVIKGLPKNGPYQPSTSMMLKFYGYFKQATEGPCHAKRPAFWDVVGKAKWDAWNNNRNLTKQQAMERYVDNLREIIETMSFTENVQNFVGSISGLDKINLDELDMIAPGMRELASSHPNSPFNSRTNSPQHGVSIHGSSSEEDDLLKSAPVNRPVTTATAFGHNGLVNGVTARTESAMGQPTSVSSVTSALEMTPSSSTYVVSNGIRDQSDDEYGDPVDMYNDLTEAMAHHSELLKQIQGTVLRMNADILSLNERIYNLEKVVHDMHTIVLHKTKSSARVFANWWPFQEISPPWFLLLVLWPFIVGRLSRAVISPHRK